MDDATYTLQQTNRERKTLSRNAKYKRNGSKSKKCTLPSDYLTPAQMKRRNGPMKTYDLLKPHTAQELREWPADLRHVYMDELLKKYNPSNEDLGSMLEFFGTSTVSRFLTNECGIRRARGGRKIHTDEQVSAWKRFISGEEPVLTLTPDEPMVVIPKAERDPEPEPVRNLLTYNEVTVKFTGNAEDLMCLSTSGALRIDKDAVYEFTVTAVRKEVA